MLKQDDNGTKFLIHCNMFIFLDPGFRMIKIKFANIQIQPKPLELPLQKKKKKDAT